jgi:hypothetical protein
MKQKENEFQIEGTIRVKRETENLNISQISLDQEKILHLQEN